MQNLQSLWLTSWFGSDNNNGSSGSGSGSGKKKKKWQQGDAGAVDAGVYTLQQPHKFPLQLDVYSGNCSFDYQQHELPSGHYQKQKQKQQQQQQQPQQQLKLKQHQQQLSAASAAQEQSTLSIDRQSEQWKFLRISSDIYETKFIESSPAPKMDDMVYQCSNQNSIYVLNAGYNPTYGDFGTHAAATRTAAAGATGREMNGGSSRTSNSIGASCSSAACSLQHKFKTFGTASGSSSVAATATATVTTTATSAAAAAASTNPVATSMSTAMCSPATAALQKLFNCNVAGDVCQNVSHRNQQQSHNNNHSNSNSNNNHHNNCPVGSHNNGCLSATGSHRCRCDPLEGATGSGAGAGTGLGSGSGCGTVTGSGCGSGAPAAVAAGALANRKKCTNVKSTLIAKKTKFLKFLEEEKWRSSQQLTADDAEAASGANSNQPHSRANSNEAEPRTASTSTSTSAAASSFAGHSASKNNNSNMKNHNNNNNGNGSQEAAGGIAGPGQQQNKLNNWSMHNDNNNKQLANYTERKLESYKQANRSSSYELYQEAADMLGLSCSLCDNCRCLDCQSGYFDCADDDDESYSEQSLMDEYDEYDYSYEEQVLHVASTSQNAALPQQSPGELELELCYAIDCQLNCCKIDAAAVGQEREQASVSGVGNCGFESEHRLAIDFDLINATSSQVLQNCLTFNDLSLLDAEQQVEPFT